MATTVGLPGDVARRRFAGDPSAAGRARRGAAPSARGHRLDHRRRPRDADPEVSRQSVYNSLHALADAGLLRRIQPAGSVARYEARIGDNHHHVVCRSCGVIADVDCAIGESPCLIASDDGGFSIDEAEVTYWGRCPACSAAQLLTVRQPDDASTEHAATSTAPSRKETCVRAPQRKSRRHAVGGERGHAAPLPPSDPVTTRPRARVTATGGPTSST